MKDDQKRKGDLAPDDEGARSFATTLLLLEDGELHSDISAALLGLNKSLSEHAKLRGKAKGELSILAKLECDEYGVVTVTTSFKTKAPAPPRRKTTMWLTPGNNLAPSNPKQVTMDLREVPKPTTKDVPADAKPMRSVP